MIGARLATSRLVQNQMGVLRRAPIRQTKLLSTPKNTLLTSARNFGGGTVGFTKVLIVFGAMGGICVTVTLATTTIGEYLTFIVMGVMAYILYFLFGDANMHRHQVTGARLFQDLHVWFTLSFIAVMWSFY
jgi:hypothetical protein